MLDKSFRWDRKVRRLVITTSIGHFQRQVQLPYQQNARFLVWLGGGNSNIFYVHPYLGKWSNLTNIFQMGWNHQPDDLCHPRFFALWVIIYLDHQKTTEGPESTSVLFTTVSGWRMSCDVISKGFSVANKVVKSRGNFWICQLNLLMKYDASITQECLEWLLFSLQTDLNKAWKTL